MRLQEAQQQPSDPRRILGTHSPRRTARCATAARSPVASRQPAFRDLKSLEDFDWRFNPSIKKNQIYDLATGQFLKERRDVLFCAPPGTGKSHLVQAIGYQLIKLGYIVLYRSIFDVVRDFLHDEAMDGHDE